MLASTTVGDTAQAWQDDALAPQRTKCLPDEVGGRGRADGQLGRLPGLSIWGPGKWRSSMVDPRAWVRSTNVVFWIIGLIPA